MAQTEAHHHSGDPSVSYDVREAIGRGAFGDVFLVVEKSTRVKYVLKKIKMARQNDWQRQATKQEIEIVSRLQHPFIMPYKEHWTHHGHTIYVVYGYCEKGDLASAINKQRGRPFPEEQLRLWLAELAFAVHYMHGQGVLHRDVKAQNILLTADGDVQLGDFGLATFRLASNVDNHDHSLVGTPHYMSPELLSSHKYGFETDIWSLGCVMYELTTLKPPFNAFNLAGLVAKIKRATLPAIPSSYSPEWGNLLRSMLRKDPARRPGALDLLACPSMRDAVQRTITRAAAIMPGIVLPSLPPAPLTPLDGFAFDAPAQSPGTTATPTMCGGNAGGGAAVHIQPCMNLPCASGDDQESSPLRPINLAAAAGATPSPPAPASASTSKATARVGAAGPSYGPAAVTHVDVPRAAAKAAADHPSLAQTSMAAHNRAHHAHHSHHHHHPQHKTAGTGAAQPLAARQPPRPTPSGGGTASGATASSHQHHAGRAQQSSSNYAAGRRSVDQASAASSAPSRVPQASEREPLSSAAHHAASSLSGDAQAHIQVAQTSTGTCLDGAVTSKASASTSDAKEGPAKPSVSPPSTTVTSPSSRTSGHVPPWRLGSGTAKPALAAAHKPNTHLDPVQSGSEATGPSRTVRRHSSSGSEAANAPPVRRARSDMEPAIVPSRIPSIRRQGNAGTGGGAGAGAATAAAPAPPLPPRARRVVASAGGFREDASQQQAEPSASAQSAGGAPHSSTAAPRAPGAASARPLRNPRPSSGTARFLPSGPTVRPVGVRPVSGITAHVEPARTRVAAAAAAPSSAPAPASVPVPAPAPAIGTAAAPASLSSASSAPAVMEADVPPGMAAAADAGLLASMPSSELRAAVSEGGHNLATAGPSALFDMRPRSVSLQTEDSELSVPSGRYPRTEPSHGDESYDPSIVMAAANNSTAAPASLFENQLFRCESSSITPSEGPTRLSTPICTSGGAGPGPDVRKSCVVAVPQPASKRGRSSTPGGGTPPEHLPERVPHCMLQTMQQQDSSSVTTSPSCPEGEEGTGSVHSSIEVTTPQGFVPMSPAEMLARRLSRAGRDAAAAAAASGSAVSNASSGVTSPTRRHHPSRGVRQSVVSLTGSGVPARQGLMHASLEAEPSFGSPSSAGRRMFTGFKIHQPPSPLEMVPRPNSDTHAEAGGSGTALHTGSFDEVLADASQLMRASGSFSSEDLGGNHVAQLLPIPPQHSASSSFSQQLAPAAPASMSGSALGSSERQRLVLLERVVSLAASLYERGKLQELGQVLASTQDIGSGAPSSRRHSNTELSSRAGVRSGVQLAWGCKLDIVAGVLRGKRATLRYHGPCHWDAVDIVGIELQDAGASGACDGSRDGVRYFRCAPGRGTFVDPAHVRPVV